MRKNMAKSKKSNKRSGQRQNRNRQQRSEPQTVHKQTSAKPAWLRIAIVVVMAIMFLGVAIMPFLR